MPNIYLQNFFTFNESFNIAVMFGDCGMYDRVDVGHGTTMYDRVDVGHGTTIYDRVNVGHGTTMLKVCNTQVLYTSFEPS